MESHGACFYVEKPELLSLSTRNFGVLVKENFPKVIRNEQEMQSKVVEFYKEKGLTVDGRNPAPPGMCKTLG